MSEVENKNRDNREASSYFHATIRFNGNEFTDILMTKREVQKAAERAVRNPEDIPPVNFVVKFWRWLMYGC